MSDKPASRPFVLVASSLKPAKDTRAWGKLGHSLRETNKYDLNFIGFLGKKAEKTSKEGLISSRARSGSVWGRITSQLVFLRALIKKRPKLVICCTYEYLPLAAALKPWIKYKLIYDVQENYIANLDLNPSSSTLKKRFAKHLIRTMESVKGIDFFFLAEGCYVSEMPEKSPYLILENKFQGESLPRPFLKPISKASYRFLISGTLSPPFGVLEAVAWFKTIAVYFPDSTLNIIGHFTLKEYGDQVLQQCIGVENIHLKGSSTPIPHDEIIEAFRRNDFLLLPYQVLPAIAEKIPTKLFEAAALGLPVLMTPNKKWLEFTSSYSGGYPVDFSDCSQALHSFSQALEQIYFTTDPGAHIFWSSQEKDLHHVLSQLLD